MITLLSDSGRRGTLGLKTYNGFKRPAAWVSLQVEMKGPHNRFAAFESVGKKQKTGTGNAVLHVFFTAYITKKQTKTPDTK